MDFDRLTITLLELGDDAPGLTPAQLDALQDAHMAHLADLHEAGHLLAAGPLLDRDSTVSRLAHSVRRRCGSPRADGSRSCRPGRQVQHHRLAVGGARRAMAFSPATFPRSAAEAAGP
jgi:uncharacterized protein